MSSELDAMKARYFELGKQIAEAEDRVRMMRREYSEIASAFATIRRFSDEDYLAPIHEPDIEARRVEPEKTTCSPESVAQIVPLKIPAMILDVITAAAASGTRSMAPKEIVIAINERWGKDVKPTSVASIAWRMADSGQLSKAGKRYSLPAPKPTPPLDQQSMVDADINEGTLLM